MLDKLDIGVKYNAYDFLEKLETISNNNGPNFSYVNFESVWNMVLNDRGNPSPSKSDYLKTILPILRKENLIKCIHKETLSITYLEILKLSEYKASFR